MASCLSPHLTTSVHLPSICLIPVFLHVITLPALQRAARYLPICPYLAPSTFLSYLSFIFSRLWRLSGRRVHTRCAIPTTVAEDLHMYPCVHVSPPPHRIVLSCFCSWTYTPPQFIHHPSPFATFFLRTFTFRLPNPPDPLSPLRSVGLLVWSMDMYHLRTSP